MGVPMRYLCAMPILAALLNGHVAYGAPTEIPCEFREGLLWIKATVAQSPEPLNFLLDTGAGASVINRGTADRLGWKLRNAVNVRGVSTTLTAYRLNNIAARAGNIPLPVDYLALDLTKLSASCQEHVDGLIGADFFRGRAVQIDFQAQKLRILQSAELPALGEILPLQMRSCGMRVPISVNGHPGQWVRLDTGCASALQWVTARVHSQDCNPKVAIGLTEISIPQTQTTVEIAGEKFENVPTGIHEHAIFAGEAGLLGNGLLSRFSSITIDTKAHRLILETNLPAR